MSILSASILAANFCNLQKECQMALDAGATMLHFDVMDGHFVPNISFGVPVLTSLHQGLPDAFYDVHLMMTNPMRYAEPFAKAGASLINFHLECADDISATIDAVQQTGCKVGLTIKPETPVAALAPYLDRVDLVLIMSVAPGFGGQAFQETAIARIQELAEMRDTRQLSFLIEVDGGINQENAKRCAAAGADVLVAGNALFAAQDPVGAAKGFLAD